MSSMKLTDYLEMKKVKPYQWAREFGYSQGAIYAWLRGESKPTLTTALKIQRDTGGDVRPEDW
jgi:DNA-binding phage protein